MPDSVSLAPSAPRSFAGLVVQRVHQRVVSDPHVLLAFSLAIGAVVIGIVGGEPRLGTIVAAGIVFLGVQVAIPLISKPSHRERLHLALPFARFALAVAFVGAVNALTGDATFRPAAALYIPVVALAAAFSGPLALAVGAIEVAAYIVPVLLGDPGHATASAQRAVGLTVTAVVISLGTRQTVRAMTIAMTRSRTARARERRRSRQISAVEEVGRLLAATGPTTQTLDRVVALLQVDLGYTYVSLYLRDVGLMRLAAYRGYVSVIEVFDGTAGIMGRVMRTGEAAYVPDVSVDPDYLSADDAVRAEISAPLRVGSELMGIVNIEATASQGLDRTDLATILLVADRLASALALAEERGRLEARAELFRRLTIFSSIVNSTLDAEALYGQIVNAMQDVIQCDAVVLSVLDRATGRYRIRAVTGTDNKYLGIEIKSGEGLAGRAIRDRAVVVDGAFARDRLPVSVRGDMGDATVAGIGVPLVRDDVVVGALTLIRPATRPYEPTELEVVPVVAGLAALSVTNTFLHGEVTESSIRDPLTGLFNRRHLDAVLAQMGAARSRRAPDDRRRVAVILFDLDHFGSFNKRYGHQTGDAVLRAFADVVLGRVRTADIAARFGGEEFVVVLDGATLEEANQVAEEVRGRFAAAAVVGPDGSNLSATVSAGCAAMGSDLGTFPEILARADMALAIAKHAGRNRVVTA